MAIAGLTDRKTAQSRVGATELFRLRKGGAKRKRTNKRGEEYYIFGEDLEYFRADGNNSEAIARFHSLYDDQPGMGRNNAIRFTLPYADLEKSFPTSMVYYKGGSQYIRCDREFIQSERLTSEGGPWVDPSGKTVGKDKVGKPDTKWVDYRGSKPACRFPDCAKGKKGMEQCDRSGYLLMVITGLNIHGVAKLILRSANELPSVVAQLLEIEELVSEHGLKLSDAPLILWREPVAISTPNYKNASQRQTSEKSLVRVALATEFEQRSLAARRQHALAAASTVGGDRPSLPPVKSALPSTDDWSDEFGARPNMSFTASPEYQDVKMAIQGARSEQQLKQAHEQAIALIQSGELPQTAVGSIKRLVQERSHIIEENNLQPVEIVEGEVVESVRDRIDSIMQICSTPMDKAAAISSDCELPENLEEWEDSDVRKFRNRAYAWSAKVASKFESPDDGRDRFRDFGLSTAYQDCPPSDDLAVWQGWVEFLEAG